MYINGGGVEKDPEEGVKWWRKAAEQGHAYAQYNLGFTYATGSGVQRNLREAAKWHRKAAEQGMLVAQYELGALYANGMGVPRDYVTAYAWFNIAAVNVNAVPKKIITDLEAKASARAKLYVKGMLKKYQPLIAKQMTPGQLAKAEALAKEMLKKNPKLLK